MAPGKREKFNHAKLIIVNQSTTENKIPVLYKEEELSTSMAAFYMPDLEF
jgi:hypothetical protein